ncbi:hypothetical protein KKA14_10550 [bacterium]|nr:hypothetical protein [bacterium]
MKKRLIVTSKTRNGNRQRIIQLCFDSQSINGFSPGLKMIYALDDSPLFVMLEDANKGMLNKMKY